MCVEAKVVEKNEAVLRKLDEMSYFSPTAINTYITCKLKYYFKYIAGIKETDEIDVDDVDNRIFGNIFHTAAQLMYEKLLPREIITAKDIDYNKIMDDKTVAMELNDTEALNEVDFYVLPHLGEEPFVESAQATLDTYSDQLNLLPLNNHQALLVEGEEVKVLEEDK